MSILIMSILIKYNTNEYTNKMSILISILIRWYRRTLELQYNVISYHGNYNKLLHNTY